MKIEHAPLDGVVLIEPRRFEDQRGFFSEVWNARALAAAGLTPHFVQDNQSLSTHRGTVRGLHYQSPPHAQGKLVRCGRGAIWDVAVDVRAGSVTYGHWVGYELSADNGRQLWVPSGFLHGFSTLTDNAEVLYKCTAHYAPEADGAVHFASPDLAIDWKLDDVQPLVSDKDAAAPDFSDWSTPFGGEAA